MADILGSELQGFGIVVFVNMFCRERERDRDDILCVHVCIYIHTTYINYIYICTYVHICIKA